ncbi:serine/threonine-protein kinase [Mycobacterium sp. pUA109]|uniref:serine/threonine-protein kinase n=1 Tax=Mycobacterium sp. pUA109 TaxID=3238982 RepID=UPI00351B49B2
MFGRYRLRGLLGAGGMGQVFRAYDTELDREIAIKVLPPDAAADPTFEARFRREAVAAAGLGEPHVIPIYDSGEIGGRLFIAMQLINGTDVATLLSRHGPMPPEQAVSIGGQAAAALDAAHDAGLVHRDVKPANLLVTPKGFVYLIDFGIARAPR